MDEKSRRRIVRYFNESSLVGENQSTAIFIPYDAAYDDVQNQQRAEVIRARLHSLEGVIGRLEARVDGGKPRDIYIVRSFTGHDPNGRRPSIKGQSPDDFKKAILKLVGDLAPLRFLFAAPRKLLERLSIQKNGEYISGHLEDSAILSGALIAWLERSPDVSNVKVREFRKPSRSWMTRMGIAATAKRDWRRSWE